MVVYYERKKCYSTGKLKLESIFTAFIRKFRLSGLMSYTR